MISPGPICAVMAAIELYTPQGAEMVSGMMYEPYEQGVIMRLEHHLVGGYVRYISPYIIIIITCIQEKQGGCIVINGSFIVS